MPLSPALHEIIALTRDRYWFLPHFLRERQRQRRNAYMRDYLRAYRRTVHRLSVSLSDAKYHRLLREAQALGRKPTTCLHQAAFAYFDRRVLLPRAYEQRLAAAIGEIRRVGNNINQLARDAHARRRATHREVQEARRLLAALEANVARLLRPLPLPAAPDGAPPSA